MNSYQNLVYNHSLLYIILYSNIRFRLENTFFKTAIHNNNTLILPVKVETDILKRITIVALVLNIVYNNIIICYLDIQTDETIEKSLADPV